MYDLELFCIKFATTTTTSAIFSGRICSTSRKTKTNTNQRIRATTKARSFCLRQRDHLHLIEKFHHFSNEHNKTILLMAIKAKPSQDLLLTTTTTTIYTVKYRNRNRNCTRNFGLRVSRCSL